MLIKEVNDPKTQYTPAYSKGIMEFGMFALHIKTSEMQQLKSNSIQYEMKRKSLDNKRASFNR